MTISTAPPSSYDHITARLASSADVLGRLDARRAELMNQIKTLSHQVVLTDHEASQIRAALEWSPAPDPGVLIKNISGRPLAGVISTKMWLKLLESNEGVEDVAHYYGRSVSGLSRLRTRALTGELPESKIRTPLYDLLCQGETVETVAFKLGRPVGWVSNYSNLLSAYSVRRRQGLPVPAPIAAFLGHA